MEDAILASRAKLKELLKAAYQECMNTNCEERNAEDLIVLPCVHVVCQQCAENAICKARNAAKSLAPSSTQPTTKYHDPRRFQCPVCSWPIYRPLDSEDFSSYPTRLPLHAELVVTGDTPADRVPAVHHTHPNRKKIAPHSYETRLGNYVFDSVIGEYGDDIENGQMRKITGMAVDEYYQTPLLVVTETQSNYILSFRLFGRLEQARKVDLPIRDVCIGRVGTVVASVAEKEYALAQWESCLSSTSGGCRLEDVFRDIYGHKDQINSEPFGVVQDSHGRFMVTMLAKDRVCCWDERRVGDNISWFGDSGQGRMKFSGPYYLAKMSDDQTVVASTCEHKVKVIDKLGRVQVKEIGGLGCELPDLCFPHGVCVDSKDNIYIADTGNFRVMVYSREGEFLGCPVQETWNYGYDAKPTNVAVMTDGRLLVAMQGHRYCKVHVYRPRKASAEDESECTCECGLRGCLRGCCCQSSWDYETLD